MHATRHPPDRSFVRRSDARCQVVDVVVASVLGVAGALVFFAWNQSYAPVTDPAGGAASRLAGPGARHLALCRHARRARHPQAGCRALHRARGRRRFRSSGRTMGWSSDHRGRACAGPRGGARVSARRGSKLATAIEASGLGPSIPRSWARESRFGGEKWMLVALSFALALAAVGTSMLTGHGNFVAEA